MKTLNLKYVSFKVGDYIVHKSLGYTAIIKKFYRGTKVDIEIIDTPENRKIWETSGLPYIVKADKIAKSFKHSPLTLF